MSAVAGAVSSVECLARREVRDESRTQAGWSVVTLNTIGRGVSRWWDFDVSPSASAYGRVMERDRPDDDWSGVSVSLSLGLFVVAVALALAFGVL